RAPVPPALPDDGRALARDGALVDRGHALDDLAVARDELPRLDQDHIPFVEVGAAHHHGPRAGRSELPVARWTIEALRRGRAAHDRQLEERAGFPVASRHPHQPHVWSSRCATTGPSARAGRNVRAPTMSTTPINSVTKSGVCVGSVPGPAGTSFFWASEPAI